MKTLTVDDSKRIRLPDARPRQVFSYEPSPDGSIKLVPVAPKEPRTIVGKMVRKDGRLFLEIPPGYTIRYDAIAKAVREERDSRS